MAAPNAKVERNNEIKSLWLKGEMTQTEIGKLFGLTQSRIMCIIYDKLPKYKYCLGCHARVSDGTALCEPCRISNKKAVKERVEEKRIILQKLRAERLLRREVERIEREERIENEKRERIRLSEERYIKWLEELRIKKEKKTEKKKLWDGFPEWHQQGRSRARFLVRLRDNYTCQECGYKRTPDEVQEYNKLNGRGKMKSLDVHHLEGFCGKNSRGYDSTKDISKLITLCHKCHFNRHDHSRNIMTNS